MMSLFIIEIRFRICRKSNLFLPFYMQSVISSSFQSSNKLHITNLHKTRKHLQCFLEIVKKTPQDYNKS